MDDSYVLSFRPSGVDLYTTHDTSAAIFKNGRLVFAAEEERYTRQKHAPNEFPANAIQACLDFCDIELPELKKIIITDDLRLRYRYLPMQMRYALFNSKSVFQTIYWLNRYLVDHTRSHFLPLQPVKQRLSSFGEPLPEIEAKSHHACHAASAFHPSSFDEALVLTIDGVGEYDSTVVWRGHEEGVDRIRTYKHPNSLGSFFGTITEFLGFRRNNGEGKVMGLAPYGDANPEIASTLRSEITVGVDYDVTNIIQSDPGSTVGVENLERLFGRDRKATPTKFTDWEKDLAYEAQQLLEEIVTALVANYLTEINTHNVALAGGVALNCKLNKKIMEMDAVDSIFIQPVASDAGLTLGAGYLEQRPESVEPLTNVYYGDEFEAQEIREFLETNKIDYYEPEDLEREIAEKIANKKLVGWFQGRMEMGPRALGNRSILADPRTEKSRDRVNKFVKHREEWRPFAPSIRYEDSDEYLLNAEEAPFMIKTFDVPENKYEEIPAVIHPNDGTTRPQTVREKQNPRYHALLTEFADITGVPMLLNTSFNDHGEPIIRTPKEAIKAFYAMGLDVLVLNDVVVEK